MYRCTKNTPQIAMHVSTLIHSQLLFKVAEVNPCRLCGQTNFRNLTDDFLPAETELSRWQHGFLFSERRGNMLQKPHLKRKKKLLSSWSLQKAVWYMALKDMVIKTNHNFTQILWYCVSQPRILGRLHEFELPFHCHYAFCFTQFGVATLMLISFEKRNYDFWTRVNQQHVAYPKKHTTVFPNMAIFGKSPWFLVEYMSTQ